MQQNHEKNKAVLHPLVAAKHYNLHRYNPSEDLTPFIEHYWIVRWQLPTDKEFWAEILPDPSVNMSFTVEGATITGVTTKKFTYLIKGSGVILGIKFRIGGFYPFLKESVATITDKVIPARDIFDGDLSAWNVQSMKRATDDELVLWAETLLRTKQPKQDEHMAIISKIINSIRETRDIRQVQTLTESFDISERTLQHLFREYVGVGPKWIINRQRLQDVAALITEDKNDWLKIALDAGYVDQSHFIHDFKNILGETPVEYSRKNLS